MEKTVLPIHFEDRSGIEFERLVFAYVITLKQWDSIEWLGQTGDDGGRDIWAIIGGESYCYQCANYRQLTLKKVTDDIDKLVKGRTVPDNFIIVCGGRVTAELRQKIKDYSHKKLIQRNATWSAVEFEEKLRNDTPHLIERYVNGNAFPDSAKELIKFTKSTKTESDKDVIDLIIECFDRPAFRTRFHSESSMPDFEKATVDTIEVLNTGVHRLRDGTVIRTIPSRHRISDMNLKSKLSDLTATVVKLRGSFIALKKTGDIRHCGCGEVDCPSYMLTPKACKQMDKIREGIFAKLKEINPNVKFNFY